MNIKRYDDEKELAYIVRVCNAKGDYTWEEVGNYLNKQLGYDYSSSKYRKAYQYYNLVKEATKDITIEEQLEEIERAKEELYKERVKIQDANREKRAVLREEARYENLIDVLKDSLYEEKDFKFKEFKHEQNYKTTTAILQLSDWHCGSYIDNQFNFYNEDVMIERANTIRDKAIKYSILHNVTDLIVEVNGDLVDGLIHVSSRVQQEECVIDQCVTVSNVLIEMINSMKPYYKSIKVVTTLGNHGRLVAGKAQCSTSENFEKIIPVRLRDNLKDITVIDSHGLDFVKYEADGKTIMLSHGQNDKLNNCISDFAKIYKTVPDEVHLGHTHSYQDINDCDIIVTVNGSLVGSDDYAVSIRKITTPHQNFIVYGEDRCIYKLNAE